MAISTDEISGITSSSASINFTLIDLGEGMNDYGVFYSISPNAHKGNKLSLGLPNATGEFSTTIDSLLPGTQYFIKAYGAINDEFAYGDELDFTTLISIPVVQTIGSSDISYTTAIASGKIISKGGANILAKGICWSKDQQTPTIKDNRTEVDTGKAIFVATITGLKKNITYFYRAYATNLAGTAYGEVLNFTTGISLPTINSTTINNIKAKSVICSGEVVADGGDSISARGVCWSINASPTINNNKTINGNETGTFTSNLTNLTTNTTYYVRAYATNSIGTSYDNEISFTTLSGIPELTTSDADTITSRSAICEGEIISDGGLDIVSYGICYDSVSDVGISNGLIAAVAVAVDEVAAAVKFSLKLTSLEINTTYYFRAYVTNEDSTFYGVEKSFTTLNGQPLVTTNDISDTTAIYAKSGGNVIDNGDFDIIARGICWNTSGSPTIDDYKTNNGTELGLFTSDISGLAINTKYYVRAYATNEKSTSYGEEMIFTTYDGLPKLTTDSATIITSISAVGGGDISDDGGFNIIARGVCWDSIGNPTINDNKTIDGIGAGSFASVITGLTLNSNYYVRAYASNSTGTTYGELKAFTTLDGLPRLITSNVTGITAISAISGGNVTEDGDFNITSRGVCWNTTGNPSIADNKTTDGIGKGTFTSNIPGLATNSSYYVRAYASNSTGTTYGEVKSFTTLDGLSKLTTDSITIITAISANGGGNISDDGGFNITSRGICWNSAGNPTINDSKTTDGMGTGTFTSSITGLSLNSNYYARAYAINATGTTYGEVKVFTTLDGLPKLIASDVAGITATFAISGGNITYDGDFNITARGVCWNTTGNPTITDNKTTDGIGTGTFTSSLIGLSLNSNYYVKAYATNVIGTTYGELKTFTTLDGIAVLTTNTITDIKANSAVCSGTISSDGGYPITERGLCWNTTGNPTISNNKTSNGSGTGSFVGDITNLNLNTIYYIRAYATNGSGTVYGIEKSFTTLDGLPVISTLSTTNITYNSASSGGNILSYGGYSITAKGVCWNTIGSPTISDNLTNNGTGTGIFSSNITSLSVNTTYYVKAYATNANGTVYGEENSFTTSEGLPVVTTKNITDIAPASASSGGNITSGGASSIIEHGVCWNTSGNPTINDLTTSDGTGTGEFSSSITGLTLNTTYYVKAFATNSNGTSYGDEISFTAEETYGTFLDSRDNNIYKWVKIGDQVWMAENLAYLPSVHGKGDPATIATEGYYVYNYEGTDVNEAKATVNYKLYGVLYNWNAAMAMEASSSSDPSDVQGACPDSWHLPSHTEWIKLKEYLTSNGNNGIEGAALKTKIGWNENGYGTDDYSFSSLPGEYFSF